MIVSNYVQVRGLCGVCLNSYMANESGEYPLNGTPATQPQDLCIFAGEGFVESVDKSIRKDFAAGDVVDMRDFYGQTSYIAGGKDGGMVGVAINPLYGEVEFERIDGRASRVLEGSDTVDCAILCIHGDVTGNGVPIQAMKYAKVRAGKTVALETGDNAIVLIIKKNVTPA